MMGRVLFDESDKPLTLWTAFSWVAPSPIPVKVFRELPPAEAGLCGMLQEKCPSSGLDLP